MELLIYLLDNVLPSPAAIHLLIHGRDLSTEGFVTPNTPPIYGRTVDIYIVFHMVMYLYHLSIIRIGVLGL
jgi:hypothetical protein